MNTNNNWFKIWNQRKLESKNVSTLSLLMKANGYDSDFAKIEEAHWLDYVFRQGEKLGITNYDSIFEVGCGAGAFLYPFYQQGNKVAGIDYSGVLVNYAQEIMPQANFEVGEAINISGDNQFDIVVCNGVFLYFPNYEYAEKVITRMVKLAKKAVGIFDIPDVEKEKEALAFRKGEMGEGEYEEKYRGLEHLFYSKDWFKQILARKLFKIEDQEFPQYGNAPYRFNVYVDRE